MMQSASLLLLAVFREQRREAHVPFHTAQGRTLASHETHCHAADHRAGIAYTSKQSVSSKKSDSSCLIYREWNNSICLVNVVQPTGNGTNGCGTALIVMTSNDDHDIHWRFMRFHFSNRI